jgi:hypothetical protein
MSLGEGESAAASPLGGVVASNGMVGITAVVRLTLNSAGNNPCGD